MNVNNKVWLIIGALIIVAVAIFLTTQGGTEENVVQVGVSLPLSGDYGIYGQKMKNGIDLAVHDINTNGGVAGDKLVVIYEDDQGDPKTAVSAFRKLVSIDKVPAVIGGAISSTAMSVAPVADKEQIVLFSPFASSPKLTGISEYFFRNYPSDVYEGAIMGQFAGETANISTIAIIYVNNDWGLGLEGEFEKSYAKIGGNVVSKESFDADTSDFRTHLAKVKEANPEALYLIGYVKELSVLLKQIEEMDLDVQLLSTYGFYDPQILDERGQIAESTIFTAPVFEIENPSGNLLNFVNEYEGKYGEKPDIFSAQAYDAMEIIGLALENGARTSPEIRDEIAKVKNFEGVSGLTTFDENGDVQKPIKFMEVRNGEFVDYILN